MKNIFCIVGLSVLTLPAWTQTKQVLEGGADAVCHVEALREVVSAEVAGQVRVAQQLPKLQTAKIINLRGQPLVLVRTDISPATQEGLSIRLLHVTEIAHHADDIVKQLSIPELLMRKELLWYKGLQLRDLRDVENILENGLETWRSPFREIFTSSSAKAALSYAFPTLYRGMPDALIIPTVVSILPEPYDLQRKEFHTSKLVYTHIVHRDIPASKIADMVLLLEMDGSKGWYKVELDGNKLILTPVSTAMVKGFSVE